MAQVHRRVLRPLKRPLGRAALKAMRSRALRSSALRFAAARGHALVLMYHRIDPRGPQPWEMVRTFSVDAFREHLDVILAVADVVGVHDATAPPGTAPAVHQGISGPPAAARPRVCLTFDDDDPRFTEHVLPILTTHRIPATFFLSGRALHGLGPYWWEHLEAEIAAEGLAAVNARLGTHAADPMALARQVIDGAVPPIPAAGAPGDLPQMEVAQMRALADAGMTIGFHTIGHPALPKLPPAERQAALRDGRDALAAAVGQPLDTFAYPYARWDDATARDARDAGYALAFTGQGRAVRRASDRWRLGRWEPGHGSKDAFAAELALRLARWF